MAHSLIKIFKFNVIAALLISSYPGYSEIHRFIQIDDGVFRGSQPTTEQDYQQLRSLGIKTIINLRGGSILNNPKEFFSNVVSKEMKIARTLGIEFRHYPTGGTFWGRINSKNIASILKDMTDPRLKPVFVHCKHGRDRTGMIAALYRQNIQNQSPEEAFAEWTSLGFDPTNRLYQGLSEYFWNAAKSNLRRDIRQSD